MHYHTLKMLCTCSLWGLDDGQMDVNFIISLSFSSSWAICQMFVPTTSLDIGLSNALSYALVLYFSFPLWFEPFNVICVLFLDHHLCSSCSLLRIHLLSYIPATCLAKPYLSLLMSSRMSRIWVCLFLFSLSILRTLCLSMVCLAWLSRELIIWVLFAPKALH